MTVAAEATAHRSRRRPRLKRIAQASVPYLLILPVIVVITAILGYPLYKLVTLSFQQYGLPSSSSERASGSGSTTTRPSSTTMCSGGCCSAP